MRQVILLVFTAALLGGCASSSLQQPATLALSPTDVAGIKQAASTGEERNKLIEALNSLKLSHYKDAVREIEAR